MTVSTELAIQNGRAPADFDGESVERQIQELVALGDKERLAEGRARAEAYAAYELRAGAKKRADHFARFKVMAEAGIGVIDLCETPFRNSVSSGGVNGKTLGPLRIGEAEVSAELRGMWRSLGMAMKRGLLESALHTVSDADEGVGTYSVWRVVQALGASYVSRDHLIERVDKTGVSRMEVAKRVATATGMSWMGPYAALSHQKKSPRIAYSRAENIAKAIGLDPSELPPAPPKRHLRRVGRKSRLRREPRLKGGRWDRAYSLHRKTMEEVFAITGESAQPTLWRNLHAVEDFLRRRL